MQRAASKPTGRVEVTPGNLVRISQLNPDELRAAQQLLIEKQRLNAEVKALMLDIQSRLTPADPVPDWVGPASATVFTGGPVDTLPEYLELRGDLKRWRDELTQAA